MIVPKTTMYLARRRAVPSQQTTVRYLRSRKKKKGPDDPPSTAADNIDPRLSEWIPPDRPLVGDKGYSHLYDKSFDAPSKKLSEEEELNSIEREVQLLEEEEHLTEDEKLLRIEEELKALEKEDQQRSSPKKKSLSQPQPTNWLQTRRRQLGDDDNNTLTPSFERPGQDLEVRHHTLLTATEIMEYLVSLGGMYPNLVEDNVKNAHGDSRMGGSIKGIIFVSGNSPVHVRMLSQSLVEQLKRRKLQEVGVMGARHGSEGSDDGDETWFCIDCHNYVVNIQDEETRRTLNLEGWWSQDDPLAEYRKAAHGNEDAAVDEFVARNPVPPNYGWAAEPNWQRTIGDLQHKRYTAPHRRVEKPISGRKKKSRGRR